jgi:hypothetical protein
MKTQEEVDGSAYGDVVVPAVSSEPSLRRSTTASGSTRNSTTGRPRSTKKYCRD